MRLMVIVLTGALACITTMSGCTNGPSSPQIVVTRERFSEYLASIEGAPVLVYYNARPNGYFAVSNKVLYRCGNSTTPNDCIRSSTIVGTYDWYEDEKVLCIGARKWVDTNYSAVGNLCVSKIQMTDVGPGDTFYLASIEDNGTLEQYIFTLKPRQ